LEDLEAAYALSQNQPPSSGPSIIEVRPAHSFEENVALHRAIGQDVTAAVRQDLLSRVKLCWTLSLGKSQAPTIVLLHGWLGEKADWTEVSKCLVEEHQQSVLSVDLPGHGQTQVGSGTAPDAWEEGVLFSLPVIVELLAELFDHLHLGPVLLAGYSLGGRVAMAFAESYPKKCIGLVALSENPGLQSPGEQRQRWLQDQKQAKQLLNSNFEEFLDRWYAAPLWGGLKERQPEVYSRMLAKRRTVRPQMAALSLRGSSLARQPPCWSPPCPLWYAYGELDAKFAAIGREIAEKSSSAGSKVHVRALPKIGHAVVEEAPLEVAKFIAEAAENFGSSSSSRPREESHLRLESAWSEPIQVMLKAPLLLARGEPLHHREGILLVLQGRAGADGPLAAGLGEVTPLPQFHKETLGEAQAQLATVLSNLAAATPEVPAELACLDGSLGRWLEKYSPGPLLPSVRAGLEMALLHLLRRDYPQPYAAAALARGLCCQSEVSINSLVAQNDDLDTDGASVAKLKVGKDPKQDAERTNRLAEKLHERRGDKARLRLDANRAWTTTQAVEFLNSLSPAAVALTDYLEEPTQWEPGQSAVEFLQQWEDVSTATGSRVRLAVDESLTEGVVSLEDLTKCKAPIAALVLKPSLQGIEQTVAMSMWALEHGAMPVLSSAFESGVALVHFALLGAALVQQPWKGDAGKVHGLGTFTRLKEDVLQPHFADLVTTGEGHGWQVSVPSCQEALDATVQALMASRGSGAHVNGWC